MAKIVNLTCLQCNIEYSMSAAVREYQLRVGKAKLTFCSRACGNQYRKDNGSHNRDQYSVFRQLHRTSLQGVRGNTRSVNVHTLTLEQMKAQWDLQQSICPYTGVTLVFRPYSESQKVAADPLHTASLDRKDNAKGYEASNIQFVSMMANYARNRFSHQQMIEFCKAIGQNWS